MIAGDGPAVLVQDADQVAHHGADIAEAGVLQLLVEHVVGQPRPQCPLCGQVQRRVDRPGPRPQAQIHVAVREVGARVRVEFVLVQERGRRDVQVRPPRIGVAAHFATRRLAVIAVTRTAGSVNRPLPSGGVTQ